MDEAMGADGDAVEADVCNDDNVDNDDNNHIHNNDHKDSHNHNTL